MAAARRGNRAPVQINIYKDVEAIYNAYYTSMLFHYEQNMVMTPGYMKHADFCASKPGKKLFQIKLDAKFKLCCMRDVFMRECLLMLKQLRGDRPNNDSITIGDINNYIKESKHSPSILKCAREMSNAVVSLTVNGDSGAGDGAQNLRYFQMWISRVINVNKDSDVCQRVGALLWSMYAALGYYTAHIMIGTPNITTRSLVRAAIGVIGNGWGYQLYDEISKIRMPEKPRNKRIIRKSATTTSATEEFTGDGTEYDTSGDDDDDESQNVQDAQGTASTAKVDMNDDEEEEKE